MTIYKFVIKNVFHKVSAKNKLDFTGSDRLTQESHMQKQETKCIESNLNILILDIDECRDDRLNHCGFRCENTEGGFHCACPQGYQLRTDGRMCEGKKSFLNLKSPVNKCRIARKENLISRLQV